MFEPRRAQWPHPAPFVWVLNAGDGLRELYEDDERRLTVLGDDALLLVMEPGGESSSRPRTGRSIGGAPYCERHMRPRRKRCLPTETAGKSSCWIPDEGAAVTRGGVKLPPNG